MGFGFWVLGFGFWGWGLGFRVYRVWGSGFRVCLCVCLIGFLVLANFAGQEGKLVSLDLDFLGLGFSIVKDFLWCSNIHCIRIVTRFSGLSLLIA